jgi:predicted nucleotidyltransferase
MFLDSYTDQINRLCESHKVRHLFAFGSVLHDEFPDGSDVDLLVDFNTNDPIDYAENYFSLKFSLEDLLKRRIDLLEQKALINRHLVNRINQSKRLLYEA